MRTALALTLAVLPLAVGCNKVDDGDGEVSDPPRAVELLGTTIRTPHVAASVCGWLFDGDQDGEVDGSLGVVTVIGTTHSDTCSMVETGNPPDNTEVEYVKLEAYFRDLPWDHVEASGNELWQYGETYVSGEEDTDEIDLDAFVVDSTGLTEVEAGGPPWGNIELIENTTTGLHFAVDATIGFVRDNTTNETANADPLETVSFEWVDVALCPCPEQP